MKVKGKVERVVVLLPSSSAALFATSLPARSFVRSLARLAVRRRVAKLARIKRTSGRGAPRQSYNRQRDRADRSPRNRAKYRRYAAKTEQRKSEISRDRSRGTSPRGREGKGALTALTPHAVFENNSRILYATRSKSSASILLAAVSIRLETCWRSDLSPFLFFSFIYFLFSTAGSADGSNAARLKGSHGYRILLDRKGFIIFCCCKCSIICACQ